MLQTSLRTAPNLSTRCHEITRIGLSFLAIQKYCLPTLVQKLSWRKDKKNRKLYLYVTQVHHCIFMAQSKCCNLAELAIVHDKRAVLGAGALARIHQDPRTALRPLLGHSNWLHSDISCHGRCCTRMMVQGPWPPASLQTQALKPYQAAVSQASVTLAEFC